MPDPIAKTPKHAQQKAPPKSIKTLEAFLGYIHDIILIRYSGNKKYI